MLEVKLTDRARRGWDWEVRDDAGKLMARGRHRDRPAAKYQAERALFQLLNVMARRPPNQERNSPRFDEGQRMTGKGGAADEAA
jgi:hypothetical protein